jgi:UDP-2,3-diacylglucosamine hydrolase
MATQTITQSMSTQVHGAGILGLVAGDGKLPALLARSAKNKGYKVIALCLSESAVARVEPHADKTVLIAPGQLGKNMGIMKSHNVDSVVFIGKVPKLSILKNIAKFDWIAIKELSKMPDFADDTIQRAIGNLTEEHGVKVLTQSEFLRELFPDYGVITKRQPTAAEYVDIEYGMRIAKEIARLDIGQTVIVRNQMLMAIEAIEGTDEAIKRAVQLARGPVVVCKVAKQSHDQRFDIPAAGLNTLKSMLGEKPGGVLAVGAHETMLVDREEMAQFADEHGIAIIAV